MKTQKLGDSYIQRVYKSEIDLLPIQTQHYHSINSLNDELLIHERKFKVLPKLKFIRGKDTRINISDNIIERCFITVPYTIVKKTIMKDCTKFHNDYIEYEVEDKIYDGSIKQFIEDKLNNYRISRQ